MDFLNYELYDLISENSKAAVYRAHKYGEDGIIILKILKNIKPSPSELARFQQQYELRKNINTNGMLHAEEIIFDEGKIALRYNEFSGEPLQKKINTIHSLEFILSLGINISDTLSALHDNNIVHTQLKPQNILVDNKSGMIKITDSGLSALLIHTEMELYNPDFISDTLPYISPEQTGRMNRMVDYRSDLYSLGTILYQLAAVQPAFYAQDPLELIHMHLAVTPTPLSKINTEIPELFSDIIQKLLAKTAEYRYQSAAGLSSDLRECLHQIKSNGKIKKFTLGLEDHSDRFNLPQRLYGRDNEINLMLEEFDLVTVGKKSLMLIIGDPGIGKSALVNEIHKPIVKQKGYFIFGKYEQFRKDVPYSGFLQAFQQLTKQLLTESPQRIEIWKNKLLNALGPNGKIITDALPDLALIIGKQPDITIMGAEESENRFRTAFNNFLNVFATQDHPLVIFLDDLQWSDRASLNMLKSILTDNNTNNLLIIGSYRDNEVPPEHPLINTLSELNKLNIIPKSIKLGNLACENLSSLLEETFKQESSEKIQTLAELIFSKTNGNPFFFIQFLKNLYDTRKISYDRESGWQWSMDDIRNLQVTDNVVELMATKIKDLPVETINILKFAACIGNRFTMEALSELLNKTLDQILFELTPALNEGLIFLANNDMYKFNHDRIQEAAYSLIDAAEKNERHYQIGKYYLEKTSEENLKDVLFYIVNQLNFGISFLSGIKEKDSLLNLNIMAGEKAKDVAAYNTAVKYFETAHSLLPERHWTVDYQQSFRLYLNYATSLNLNGNFNGAENIFEEAIKNAHSREDRARVYNYKLLMLANLGKHREAFYLGIKGLRLLGVYIPRKNNKINVLMAIIRSKLTFGRIPISKLEELQLMTRSHDLLAVEIMSNMMVSAYFFSTEGVIICALKMIKYTVKHGISGEAAYSFIMYGFLLGFAFSKYKEGLEYGELGIKIMNQFNHKSALPKASLLMGSALLPTRAPIALGLNTIIDGLQIAIDNGDKNNMIYLMQTIIFIKWFSGAHLTEIYADYEKYFPFMEKAGDPGAYNYFISVRQTIKALQGKTVNPNSLDDDNFKEEDLLAKMYSDNIPIILQRHFLLKMRLHYYHEDYKKALDAANNSFKYLTFSLGTVAYNDYFFFTGLIIGAVYKNAKMFQKIFLARKLDVCIKKMEIWNKNSPDNYSHRHALLLAEKCLINNDNFTAIKYYQQSAESAIKYDAIQVAAIAYERLGKLLVEKGLNSVGLGALTKAEYFYNNLGAKIKSDLIAKIISQNKNSANIRFMAENPAESYQSSDSNLDLLTVLKISQAIANEIMLDKLLQKLIKIMIENAGAERGYILFTENDQITIASEGSSESEMQTQALKPIDDYNDIPHTIINYVYRTSQDLLLADAITDEIYASDPYIKRVKAKSILCMPIMHQNKTVAILYLENNLAEGIFTLDRIKILKMLSTQIAASLVNARLYSDMENKITERTSELNNTLKKAEELKIQQDGDYFLTSLLLDPLSGNYSSSNGVNIEFFIKEKKEFEFRNKEKEIGGDICIAYDLKLKERQYSVILNSDAMGKSIQGAGGCLVLGAVFKSIMDRTINNYLLRDRYPEQWISESFAELQRVFESFDCCMLMSMVIGLVDKESGVIYFINAEHPYPAIYRNNKAEFIKHNSFTRKVGTPGMELPQAVEIFQLRPGDLMFIGSDGRDDLLLDTTVSGQRIINEDETLFLRNIENARGDLSQLTKNIISCGELTDDLSLIKLSYHPNKKNVTAYTSDEFQKDYAELQQVISSNNKEKLSELCSLLLERYQEHASYLKKFAALLIQNSQFHAGIDFCNAFLEKNQLDNKFIYQTSRCYKKIHNLSEAINLGERVYYREPENIDYILNLAALYAETNRISDAENLLNKAFSLDPNNQKAHQLIQTIF